MTSSWERNPDPDSDPQDGFLWRGLRLTRRGEYVIATVGVLVFLFALALVGGIEQGTL